jgi:hypothetical protein
MESPRVNDEAAPTPDLTSLLDAAGALIPADAVVAAAGVAEASVPDSSRTIVTFDDGHRPADSAVAIVALERSRSTGVSFLALPAPTNQWLDDLHLFADHCRRRYPVVLESQLGTVLALHPAVEQGSAAPTAQGASSSAGSSIVPEPLDAIDALALPLSRLVRDGSYSGEEFRRFEQRGVHVTPVHFYSPIPDTSKLGEELWQRESGLVGIDMNDDEQLRLVADVFPQFREECDAIPFAPTEDPSQFYLDNGLFGGTDAFALYCMLRHLQPRRVLEVGGGFSTRLAAQAALANGSTELVCIEPFPDAVLQDGFPGLTTLISSRVEETSLDLFLDLKENDVLFIDSSHVARTGGDVTFLFLEVLPRLQPGVVVQVHDVFIPFEYARDWVEDGLRFWNEQYLLQAFLAFNSDFRVLLANSYFNSRYADVLQGTFPNSPWWGGGSFWFQRAA